MKRKTVNEIVHFQHPRPQKKNKSCLLNPNQFKRTGKHHHINNLKGFACSSAVVDLLIAEWLENLDDKFRASDQRQFYQGMMNIVDISASALSNMLDPLSLNQQSKLQTVKAQAEPHPASSDLFCVGNNVVCETKLSKMPRISIKMMMQAQQKNELQRFNTSKSITSTKSLFKLHKQQQIQHKHGLQALKEEETGQHDVFQQILREKITKQKKNIYLNKEKMIQGKHPALPSIQQFSFDYDGTIFPIKKTSIQSSHKVKILNTTCKVLNRQFFENRKQSIVSKARGMHLKTQMEQTEKQNKRYGQGLKRGLSQRRISNTDSTRQLMRICTETDELTFKTRIQQAVVGKYAKLRELKGH